MKAEMNVISLKNRTTPTVCAPSSKQTQAISTRSSYIKLLRKNAGNNFAHVCKSFAVNFADWNSYSSSKDVTEAWMEEIGRIPEAIVKSVLSDITRGKVWESHFSPRLREFLKLCDDEMREKKEEGVKNPFVDELGFYADDAPDKVLRGWASHLFNEYLHPTWYDYWESKSELSYPSYCGQVFNGLLKKDLAWIKAKIAEKKAEQENDEVKDRSAELRELISGMCRV